MTEPTSTHSPPSLGSKTLSLLDERIRASIEKRGFSSLSDVQEQAIPSILSGEHVLLIAPTGTGKTESAMLPVFDFLLREPGPGIKALYITPLRSLNRDILSRLQWWAAELGLSVGVRHGDTTQAERRKQAVSPPDLLITTPETLQAMFMGSRLRTHLSKVRHVIIDEIHELAGSKRGAQLAVAIERLALRAGEFQRIALSATVGNPERVGRFLCGDRPFALVHIPVAPSLSIDVRHCGDEFPEQVACVAQYIDREPSTLLFVNTRSTAEALGHALYSRGDVEVHHGSLSREVRIDAEDRFKNRQIRALIATSSMELGIDIGHVEHVLQFGSPREVARLVQRVGRAGHTLGTVSRGTIVTSGIDDLLESLIITRKAKANECEEIRVHEDAADVLANQVAALAVEYGEITIGRMITLLGKTSCFPAASTLLPEVCAQMAAHRLISLEGETIRRTRRSRTYLSSNLSMIHDERKVGVFDIISRRTVGTLDESFVVSWLEVGESFITKGQLWRVLEIEDGRVTVEPARHARGEVPSWEGEQIPVPFAVAREVGALRRTGDFDAYPVDADGFSYATSFLERAARPHLPSDRLVTIEAADEGVVLNCCAGHRVNETLARTISILLSARLGTTVGIEVSAYRVFFRLPARARAADLAEVLSAIEPEHVRGILDIALRRTALYKWKLVQVAKKFGAIDADADYERISIHRLLDRFEGTVVEREAYRELYTQYMDVAGAETVVREIRGGVVEVKTGKLSPFGREGLFSSRDMIPPPTVDQAVISAIRQRLERDHVVLFCMHCRDWKQRTEVARVPDQPRCPKCGAALIAALKPWEEECIPPMKKKRRSMSEDERRLEVRLLRNANIVLSSGKKAVIALSARGVGPEAASRILATQQEGDAFYREIIKAERNYVRTHRFW
jgi:ATP-dependent Lhr-like helicase